MIILFNSKWKSFYLTARLLAYRYDLPTKPGYLIPPARFYKANPMELSPALKFNDVGSDHRVKSQKEIQANAFLSLARGHYNKKETQKARESRKSSFLSKMCPRKRVFSRFGSWCITLKAIWCFRRINSYLHIPISTRSFSLETNIPNLIQSKMLN